MPPKDKEREPGKPLKEYRAKRRFDRTAEPEGKVKPGKAGRLYVIQKHAASRLHYDLRLELDGVLKSWAVPKGPSLNPAEKHLAVQVEDHPVEYGGFEGIIPRDEYGGGTVMLWDTGEWEPLEDPRRGYKDGNLKFRLNGQKLKGRWVLVRMRKKDGEEDKNWLLIKEKDEYVRTESGFLDEEPLSAVSGRSMEEIAADRERVWSASTQENKPTVSGTPGRAGEDASCSDGLRELPGARRNDFPSVLTPQLTTLVARTPSGDDWLHEIKYDGYRILGFKNNSGVRLITRRGNDWTDRFPEVEQALEELPADNAVTDGEVVVRKPDGTTDFQALQNLLKGISSGQLNYYLFDLLYLNGFDLTRTPLIERKERLRCLLAAAPAESLLRFSDHIRGSGESVYQHACRFALEGIVSKRFDAPYLQQRNKDWVKSKCLHRQEFVITGFSRPSGSRSGFGALLLGYYDSKGELRYAGKVGTGFNEKTLRELIRDLKSLKREGSPLSNPPTGAEAKGVRWVRPERVAEIEFAEWTEKGRLRQPSFKGIREDKRPGEVVREQPEDDGPRSTTAKHSAARENTEKPAKRSPSGTIAGMRLTHSDKVLYPEMGITKGELAEFYDKTADWILPHITRRPLTVVRCPEGQGKNCFYQKHLTEQVPSAVKGIPVSEKDGEETYLMIEDLAGLISLVQLGALELHPWGSRADRLEFPDRMVFDMDPGPGISPGELVEGCRLLRDLLADIGLKSYLKTSGGKGFHLVVPLTGRSDWDEVKAFSGAVANMLVKEQPRRFVANMSKAKRNEKIFVDYFRNGRGATTVAPFSTRARAGAPVSTPVAWDELDESLTPDAFTVKNLPKRLKSLRHDPWDGFFALRQSVAAVLKKKPALGK